MAKSVYNLRTAKALFEEGSMVRICDSDERWHIIIDLCTGRCLEGQTTMLGDDCAIVTLSTPSHFDPSQRQA